MERLIDKTAERNLKTNFLITEGLFRPLYDLKGWESVYQTVAMDLNAQQGRNSLNEMSSIAAVLAIVASKDRQAFVNAFDLTRSWKSFSVKSLRIIQLELLRHATIDAIWTTVFDSASGSPSSRASIKSKLGIIFQRDFEGTAVTTSGVKSLLEELIDLANIVLKSKNPTNCLQTYEVKYPIDKFCRWASKILQTVLINAMSNQKLHFASSIPKVDKGIVDLRVVSTPGAPLKAKKRKRMHTNDRDKVKRNFLISSFPSCGPMYWDSDNSETVQPTKMHRIPKLPTNAHANSGEDVLTDGVFKDIQKEGRPICKDDTVSELGDEDIADESTNVPSPISAAQRLNADDDLSESTFWQGMPQNTTDEIKKAVGKNRGNISPASPGQDDEQLYDDFTADSSWAERFKLALWRTFSPGIL